MDAAIRKKRSNEGSRRSELETQLAELRDQEAELVRAIELVLEYESTGKGIGDVGTPILTERPTAEEKDYELKLKHVTEAHKRRNKLFWTDVRKVITSLLSHKPVKSVFGVSVRETPWGIVAKNWEQYTSIISKPMDLNTIKQKLGDEDRSPQYKSPHEVAEDVRLIVDNCLTFNSDPQNEPVRKIADQLNQMFDKKWRDGAFEQRWQKDRAQEQMDYEELSDLQAAAKGTTADKIRYFDNCVRRRLQDLQTGEPKPGKPFSWEQKRKLSLACSKLSDEHCQSLMDIIAKSPDMPEAQDGEVVLDIGSLPDAVLYSMQKFVDSVPKSDVHMRAVGAPQPAARPQPANEPPAVLPTSAAAPVTANAEPMALGKVEPGVAAPVVDEAAMVEPAVAAPSADRGGNAATPSTPAAGGVKDQPKSADASREGGRAEQPKEETAEPPANGRAEPQSGGSRDSSSSSSDASSSSSDDKSDRSSNSSGQDKNKSPDSQQDESNHGPGSGKGSIEDNDKRTSADVGETVLVSRNVPIGGEKAVPAILKAKDDAKEIQIENEDDWAVPADDDDNEDAQAMDAEDTPQAAPADGAKARPPAELNGVVRQQ